MAHGSWLISRRDLDHITELGDTDRVSLIFLSVSFPTTSL